MAHAVRLLDQRLSAGPARRAELEQLLGKPVARAIGMWVSLVRLPPSGTWECRRADLYGTADAWLGSSESSEDAGTAQLVRSYLRGFGPAARGEIANYAGLGLARIDAALASLEPLRRFRAEDGELLYDVPRGALPAAETPAPVRFLPTWDATLLVHARRTGSCRRSTAALSSRPSGRSRSGRSWSTGRSRARGGPTGIASRSSPSRRSPRGRGARSSARPRRSRGSRRDRAARRFRGAGFR